MTERLIPLADIYGVDDDREFSWMDRAVCAEVDPALHFPEKGGSALPAKRVCRSCEVRAECLEFALARNEMHGIWGGLSYEERERVIPAYARGTSVHAIIAAADADQNRRRDLTAEHIREAGLARRREPSPGPQSQEVAA